MAPKSKTPTKKTKQAMKLEVNASRLEHLHNQARESVDATHAAHRIAAAAQRRGRKGGPDGRRVDAGEFPDPDEMMHKFLGRAGKEISVTISKESEAWADKLSHKDRKYDRCRENACRARMVDADKWACQQRGQEKLERQEKQIVELASREVGPARPERLYGPGQSAIQWWASWMKEAPELPQSYNKSNRPKWYSAEVTAYVGWIIDRKYCGVKQTGHFYAVY